MLKLLTRTRSAFTLIELLVVVAIIATLIAILLPSLAAAREQARVSMDLSNQRQVAMATASYVGDNSKDSTIYFAFPIGFSPGYGVSYSYYTEVVSIGAIPDVTDAQMQAAGAGVSSITQCDAGWFTPKTRPLNKYITPDMSWDDNKRIGNAAARVNNPMVLPAVFKCPSDRTCKLPYAESPNGEAADDTPFPSWKYWGVSYASNWYWPYYYTETESAPYQGNFLNVLAGTTSVKSLGRKLMGNKQGRFASEFIIFEEEQMDYALADSYPRGYTGSANPKNIIGWHGKVDYHVAAFLDGGARYKKFDTRYVDGPGWTVWPSRPWAPPWDVYQDK